MRSTIAVSVRRATNREVMRSTFGKGNRLEILAYQLDGVNSACGKQKKNNPDRTCYFCMSMVDKFAVLCIPAHKLD